MPADDLANVVAIAGAIKDIGIAGFLFLALWALLTERVIPKGTHLRELTALEARLTAQLADRDAQIERKLEQITRLETDVQRWQTMTLESLDRGERALDLVGAPNTPRRRRDA